MRIYRLNACVLALLLARTDFVAITDYSKERNHPPFYIMLIYSFKARTKNKKSIVLVTDIGLVRFVRLNIILVISLCVEAGIHLTNFNLVLSFKWEFFSEFVFIIRKTQKWFRILCFLKKSNSAFGCYVTYTHILTKCMYASVRAWVKGIERVCLYLCMKNSFKLKLGEKKTKNKTLSFYYYFIFFLKFQFLMQKIKKKIQFQ